LGQSFDLVAAPLEVIDRCALENGGFVVRNERCAGLCPVELQLQWRVSSKKQHRGRSGLDRRRASASRRIAWFESNALVAVGATLTTDMAPHGEVIACEPAPGRDGVIGLALLDRGVAHPQLRFLADSGIEVTTVSPPLVEPLSQRVRPQIDYYATRDPLRFAAAEPS
jgi:glycine cleavage system aminomethyltransferase T